MWGVPVRHGQAGSTNCGDLRGSASANSPRSSRPTRCGDLRGVWRSNTPRCGWLTRLWRVAGRMALQIATMWLAHPIVAICWAWCAPVRHDVAESGDCGDLLGVGHSDSPRWVRGSANCHGWTQRDARDLSESTINSDTSGGRKLCGGFHRAGGWSECSPGVAIAVTLPCRLELNAPASVIDRDRLLHRAESLKPGGLLMPSLHAGDCPSQAPTPGFAHAGVLVPGRACRGWSW